MLYRNNKLHKNIDIYFPCADFIFFLVDKIKRDTAKHDQAKEELQIEYKYFIINQKKNLNNIQQSQ